MSNINSIMELVVAKAFSDTELTKEYSDLVIELNKITSILDGKLVFENQEDYEYLFLMKFLYLDSLRKNKIQEIMNCDDYNLEKYRNKIIECAQGFLNSSFDELVKSNILELDNMSLKKLLIDVLFKSYDLENDIDGKMFFATLRLDSKQMDKSLSLNVDYEFGLLRYSDFYDDISIDDRKKVGIQQKTEDVQKNGISSKYYDGFLDNVIVHAKDIINKYYDKNINNSNITNKNIIK